MPAACWSRCQPRHCTPHTLKLLLLHNAAAPIPAFRINTFATHDLALALVHSANAGGRGIVIHNTAENGADAVPLGSTSSELGGENPMHDPEPGTGPRRGSRVPTPRRSATMPTPSHVEQDDTNASEAEGGVRESSIDNPLTDDSHNPEANLTSTSQPDSELAASTVAAIPGRALTIGSDERPEDGGAARAGDDSLA